MFVIFPRLCQNLCLCTVFRQLWTVRGSDAEVYPFLKCWRPLLWIFVIRHLITWPASYACGSASSRQISSYWDFMSANVAEIIECWSLMTFICQLSASLKTEQAQICVQPHVQTSFLTWKCTRTSTTLSSVIFYVLNDSIFVVSKQSVGSDMLQ